jgi:RNA 2',3'-cyclic 3'-phosphodiesterase
MRLFTAIDLPAEMLEKLGEFLARLRPLAKLRWTAVENLHITTKFIGEWPESRIEDMKTALGRVHQSGPIDVAVRGVGWFPNLQRPRVFWAGVEAGEPPGPGGADFSLQRRLQPAAGHRLKPMLQSEARATPLAALARSTEQAVTALGVPVEERAYSPHLTLARVKDAVRLDGVITSAGDPDFGAFQASSFFLYLSANGKYSKLAEFPLNS